MNRYKALKPVLFSKLLFISGCAVSETTDPAAYAASLEQDKLERQRLSQQLKDSSSALGPISPAQQSQRQEQTSVASYRRDIDRIQGIRDPQSRADANVQFVQSITQNLNASMASHGININDMAYQSNYDAARRRGMTPAEADAEARQFVEMWQMMSR